MAALLLLPVLLAAQVAPGAANPPPLEPLAPANDAPPPLATQPEVSPPTPTPAAAAPPATSPAVARTRLIYVPGVFAAQCPSDADVRARTVQSLGVDPFLEPAEKTAILVVEGEAGDDSATPPRAPRVLRVRLELVDADYGSLGARTLDGDERCDELVAAATLALAIALDPTRALAPPPAPPTPAPLAPPARVRRVIVRGAPRVDDVITGALPEGTRATFFVGGHSGVLLTPALQSGVHLGATWRGDWWGVGAALRTDVPAGNASGAMLGTLLGCGHLGLAAVRPTDTLGLLGCLTSSAGGAWSLDANGGGGPYLGVGGRAGAEWVMQDASALAVWAQLEWGLVRPGFVGGLSASGTVASPVNLVLGTTFELGWPL